MIFIGFMRHFQSSESKYPFLGKKISQSLIHHFEVIQSLNLSLLELHTKYSSINKENINKAVLNLFHCVIKIPLFVLREKTSQNDSGNLGKKQIVAKGFS